MAGAQLHPEWLQHIGHEFDQPYMRELKAFLRQRREAGAVIYPPPKQWFAALDATPPSAVRVVVLGQDPYHGPGQAHGLCFSVQPGVPVPPSLKNIYRELHADLGLPVPEHGCLEAWAQGGVLLLNTVLTVEKGQPGAHQGKGWEQFTDRVIDVLSREGPPSVFLLWGGHAQKKGVAIDSSRHLVLTAPHPSPLSAHRGFLGCRHFSQANAWLEAQGRDPVNWVLPPGTGSQASGSG